MEKKKFEKKQNIKDLIKDDWFKDINNSSCWLRIYPMLPVPQKKILEYFKHAFTEITVDGLTVGIRYLGCGDLELPNIGLDFMYSDPEKGHMCLAVKNEKKKLPQSSYIFILVPFKVDGKEGDKAKTINALNQAEAILSGYIGNNLLHTLIYDEEIELTQNGAFINKSNSPIIKTVQPCDGPFISKGYWDDAGQTFKALESLEEESEKKRILLALKFFQNGKKIKIGIEQFFFYWTAIITLCKESGTTAINQNYLQPAYDLNKEEIEEKLLWKKLYTIRNNLFKFGAEINFHHDVERYLQLLFLDILRRELNLPNRKYALNAQKNLNLDVIQNYNYQQP